jgi:hypothetical protein
MRLAKTFHIAAYALSASPDGAPASYSTRCRRKSNWLPWLKREFGWSDDTALNFMRVEALFPQAGPPAA